MKACFLAILSLLIASSAHAQLPDPEEQFIEYSKSIDVKTLDPSLPSQRLEDWLRSGPPHAELLRWESDPTCDIKGLPGSGNDSPRCVRITFGRGGQSGYLLVRVGTFHKGIIGAAQLYEGIGVQEPAFIQTGWADKLSDLPHLLDQPLLAPVVRHLFDEIVKRHPLGIPKGADATAIRPFLSNRLIQQLETAQACQDDYFRQHPKPGNAPKPAWLQSGLFVGNSKRATPFYENIVSHEPLKDGSVGVNVVLSYDKAWVNRGGGFTPDYMSWVVAAIVIPENSRLVVDDVRLFDGLDTEGPSHLLSEAFAGCDSPHWTGKDIAAKPPAPLPLPHFTDWTAVNILRAAAYKEEVAFAKAIDVHQLDPSLPSQRLEDWLKSAPLHIDHVEWAALGCNITEGQYGATRNRDGGLCATIWFNHGNATVDIKVGARGPRISARPKLEYMRVKDKDEDLLTTFFTDKEDGSDSDRLSYLPRLLNQESVIDITRSLYDTVVEYHPLGSPQGEAKTRIDQLLSQRLRKQLEQESSCQEDYLRKSPTSQQQQKPAWIDAGLFSGNNEMAAPEAALVGHKEQQDDGSFRVTVWLSHKDSAIAGSDSSPSSWRNWHISALVRHEDGRFVIDDIRIFGGLSADATSYKLSDEFAGCDSSH